MPNRAPRTHLGQGGSHDRRSFWIVTLSRENKEAGWSWAIRCCPSSCETNVWYMPLTCGALLGRAQVIDNSYPLPPMPGIPAGPCSSPAVLCLVPCWLRGVVRPSLLSFCAMLGQLRESRHLNDWLACSNWGLSNDPLSDKLAQSEAAAATCTALQSYAWSVKDSGFGTSEV